jgi:hypothetical protein
MIANLLAENVSNDIINICGDGCISLREVVDAVPSYNLRYAVENPPVEHYEVNIEKISKIATVPKTKTTVLDFVRSYTSGDSLT